MMKRRKINMRKLRDELLCLAGVVLGIVVFILNATKTIPGTNGIIEAFVSFIIGYGFLIGPAIVLMSISVFWEIRNTNYSRKNRKGAR